MGHYVFKLPDVGEGTAEAELVAWHIKPGDLVKEDEPVVDVMTDKATVEIPAPATGKVVSVKGTPGEMLAVGSAILVLEVDGPGNAGTEDVELSATPPPAVTTFSNCPMLVRERRKPNWSHGTSSRAT